MLGFLAAMVAALTAVLGISTAPMYAADDAENRVRASIAAVEQFVGPSEHITAGQQLGEAATQADFVVATGVAAKRGDGAVRLFRHASPDELADLKASGTFNPGSSSTGKYFADSVEDASRWGAWLNKGDGGIVSTTVSRSFADHVMRWERLDGIGPARFASPERLDSLNSVMSGVRFH